MPSTIEQLEDTDLRLRLAMDALKGVTYLAKCGPTEWLDDGVTPEDAGRFLDKADSVLIAWGKLECAEATNA